MKKWNKAIKDNDIELISECESEFKEISGYKVRKDDIITIRSIL